MWFAVCVTHSQNSVAAEVELDGPVWLSVRLFAAVLQASEEQRGKHLNVAVGTLFSNKPL